MGHNTLGELFGKSPIQPIQAHMKSVLRCAEMLPEFIKASFASDWILAAEIYNKICHFENVADTQKKDIRLHLPRSFFMPIPRNDLLVMIDLQDVIANTVQDIAGLMLGRELTFPNEVAEIVGAYVNSSVAVIVETVSIIDELDELLESGFGNKEIQLIERLVTAVDEHEAEADDQQILLRRQLKQCEDRLSAVDVMFMYRVIELIGDVSDSAKRVGDQIHIIVAR